MQVEATIVFALGKRDQLEPKGLVKKTYGWHCLSCLYYLGQIIWPKDRPDRLIISYDHTIVWSYTKRQSTQKAHAIEKVNTAAIGNRTKNWNAIDQQKNISQLNRLVCGFVWKPLKSDRLNTERDANIEWQHVKDWRLSQLLHFGICWMVGIAYKHLVFYLIQHTQLLCSRQELAYTPEDPPRRVHMTEMSFRNM